MGDTLDLGELVSVAPRDIWPHEASNFTPWLAEPENVARLGVAIGLELEVEDTEVGVGPYSADILARELRSSGYVVIENPLERVDHDHLGKAITYAATLDATTIVWVAPRLLKSTAGRSTGSTTNLTPTENPEEAE